MVKVYTSLTSQRRATHGGPAFEFETLNHAAQWVIANMKGFNFEEAARGPGFIVLHSPTYEGDALPSHCLLVQANA